MTEDVTVQPIVGSELSRYLGPGLIAGFEARTRARNLLAVDLVQTGPGQVVETLQLPQQAAFHVVLQLQDMPSHELWIGGRLIRTQPYPRHSVSIIDLSQPSRTRINAPHQAMLFTLDQQALEEVSAEFGTERFDTLRLAPGIPALDPVMARLGAALRPRLAGTTPDRLWSDQMLLLVQAHVATVYGAVRPLTPPRGGLAPWQERRAKAAIERGLTRSPTLIELARDVGLSPAHFARSFQRSTGLTPYGWLTRHRMEAARTLLLSGQNSIAEVAQATGYAEQSSFSRAFSRHVGLTPSDWARSQKR